jgi:hypothetical protein
VLGNVSAVYMQLGATDRALAAANGALHAAEATADGQGIVFSHKSGYTNVGQVEQISATSSPTATVT